MKWLKKTYTESLKKIVGAVLELPAKYHSQYSPITPKFGWIGGGIFQATPKWLPRFFFKLSAYIFKIISLRIHKPQSPSHF
jgi:hypothetical protein